MRGKVLHLGPAFRAMINLVTTNGHKDLKRLHYAEHSCVLTLDTNNRTVFIKWVQRQKSKLEQPAA
jgi:hypothetical protein